MSLSEHYSTALKQPDMVHDALQEQAIIKLEALSQALTTGSDSTFLKILSRLSPFKAHRPQPVQGLYLWGGVGRGKTWLMNLFYEELAIKEKSRIHFHHFMLEIHEKLDALSRQKTRKKIRCSISLWNWQKNTGCCVSMNLSSLTSPMP